MLADADSLFKKVLKELRPVFKEAGFRASSQNFTLESPECWAVINFQKSRWSLPTEKTFYVNVAVTAKRLMAFASEPTDKPPAYYSCIWRNRAEQLGPDCGIQEWTVRDEDTVSEVVEYLRILLGDFVIPAVKAMMSEDTLVAEWTRFPKLGYQQLKAMSVLLAADGKPIDLRQTLFQLHEAFGTGVVGEGVRSHMERLRSTFPDTMQSL